jgi:hypothetical protein
MSSSSYNNTKSSLNATLPKQKSYLVAESLSLMSKNETAVRQVAQQIDTIKGKELPIFEKKFKQLRSEVHDLRSELRHISS